MKTSLHNFAVAFALLISCGEPFSQGPTWHGDVRPIAEKRCGECHVPGGPGIAFDMQTTKALWPLSEHKIGEGLMPPWLPSDSGVNLHYKREITPLEVATIVRWVKNPLEGRQADYRAPALERRTFPTADPARYVFTAPFSVQILPGEDRVFCFKLRPRAGKLGAYRWMLGAGGAKHHMSLDIIAASEAAAAPADGSDCTDGYPRPLNPVSSLVSTSLGPDGGFLYPEGTGVEIPAGALAVLAVHYHGSVSNDVSGVDFFYAADSARPVRAWSILAPSELPCPTGPSLNPHDPCSREYAKAHSSAVEVAQNDWLLGLCGAPITDPPTGAAPEHWFATSTCTWALTEAGKLVSVRPHMHTRGVAWRMEIEKADGSWSSLLDIAPSSVGRKNPGWRWRWESSFAVAEDLQLQAGQRVRLTCKHDNGDFAQPNEQSGAPAQDGPAPAPRRRPRYQWWGQARDREMCLGSIELVNQR
jgi:hypothetical protein